MADKEYNITTLEDILKVVNNKNIDNFLIDFSNWLHMNIKLKSSFKIKAAIKLGIVKIPNNFSWTDDKKNNITLIVEEKEKMEEENGKKS